MRVAFGLLSAAWLAATCANPIEKVETVGKMLVFVDFRGDVWDFSRFEGFVKLARGLLSPAWLAARWAKQIEKMLVFLGFQR